MAKEWYLLNLPHDQLSGYEDDALYDFAEESFLEVLDSSLASVVELCNYDLTECNEIRAIIQNNVQDTALKTLSRSMLVPIGTCVAGMYVKYDNRYWLITGLVDDNGMYEKALLMLCNYLLSWVNSNGEIIQRWANITSASQYNNGETGSTYFFIRSDQLMILTSNDDECMLLSSGQRFIIDKRCILYEREFADDITSDTSNTVITYKITRTDSVLYNYEDSGYYEFLVTEDEQHDSDGYYVVDGVGYWLCDDVTSYNKNTLLSSSYASISCDSDVLYIGLDPITITASFTDADGNTVSVEPSWEIECDYLDYLTIEYDDMSVLISTDNHDLSNKTLIVTLTDSDGEYDAVSATITIRAMI